jgi:hypothetical protein
MENVEHPLIVAITGFRPDRSSLWDDETSPSYLRAAIGKLTRMSIDA